MSTARELFHSGKLTEAIALVTESVKKQPSDVDSRGLLAELLCFAGELERADKQLDATAQLLPSAAFGAGMMRHLVRAELSRREVYLNGRVPEFTLPPSDSQQLRLRALLCIRENKAEEASQLIEQACALEPEVELMVNGQSVRGFRDLDDLLGPNLEVYTATGKYYWISVERLVSLEFSKPDSLGDLLWRAAVLETDGDVTGRVHIPVLYQGSSQSEDPLVRVGRATEWNSSGEQAPMLGAGQREFLSGDDQLAILEISRIERPDTGSNQ
jgi:type VI secretion system protein ImpE